MGDVEMKFKKSIAAMESFAGENYKGKKVTVYR